MSTQLAEEPVVNEEIWNQWIKKGRIREAATDRKMKFAVLLVLGLLALAGAYLKQVSQ